MRLSSTRGRQRRRGVALLEFAFLAPVLFILLVGLWEVGRLIQVKEILTAAAAQGLRIGAQGQIINSVGSPTLIATSSGDPNVTTTVQAYLIGAGITNLTGLQVQFQFLTGDTSRSNPYQGTKGDTIQVTVTIPTSNFSWLVLGLVNPTSLSGQVSGQMLVDSTFTVNTTIPGWSP